MKTKYCIALVVMTVTPMVLISLGMADVKKQSSGVAELALYRPVLDAKRGEPVALVIEIKNLSEVSLKMHRNAWVVSKNLIEAENAKRLSSPEGRIVLVYHSSGDALVNGGIAPTAASTLKLDPGESTLLKVVLPSDATAGDDCVVKAYLDIGGKQVAVSPEVTFSNPRE